MSKRQSMEGVDESRAISVAGGLPSESSTVRRWSPERQALNLSDKPAQPSPRPWKLEVLGHSLRIVEDTGSEFENDVLVVGHCRDDKAQSNAELIVAAVNAFAARPVQCNKCGDSGRMWDGNGGDMTECDCRTTPTVGENR